MTGKLRRHDHELLTTFGANLKHLFLARALARTHNTGLAKVAVQCSADTFVVNQILVLRINICGENRHLRQARNRYASL
jgi:hypothetical protein